MERDDVDHRRDGVARSTASAIRSTYREHDGHARASAQTIARDDILRSLVRIQYCAQRRRLRARHVPRPRRHGRDLPGVRGAGACASSCGATRSSGSRRSTRSPARRSRSSSSAADLSGQALRHHAADARARRRARSAPSWPSGSPLLRHGGQAARGAAARVAHELRHRDDARDRHLRRDRELLAPPRRAAARASGPPASSTTSPTTSSSSSTSRTSRCRRSAACSTATARAS